jgi:hypothetical protein
LLFPREGLRTAVITWLRQPLSSAKRSIKVVLLISLAKVRKRALNICENLESRRRYATLIAVLLDPEATITDQILRCMTPSSVECSTRLSANRNKALLSWEKRSTKRCARVDHALIDARQKGLDPYAAIEGVMAWDSLSMRRSGWLSQGQAREVLAPLPRVLTS